MTIQTKYNIGDDVWFMHDNQIVSGKIDIISTNSYRNRFTKNELSVTYTLQKTRKINGSADSFVILRAESELFPTKQDLLNSL